jgi:predicted nuclease with TOPRIM domain
LLRHRLEESAKDKENLSNKVAGLEADHNQFMDNFKKYLRENQQAVNSNSQLADEHEALQKRYAELQTVLADQQKQYASLMTTCQTLQQKQLSYEAADLEGLRAELNRYLQKVADLEKENTDLRQSSHELTFSNNELKETQEEFKETFAVMSKERFAFEDRAKALAQDLEKAYLEVNKQREFLALLKKPQSSKRSTPPPVVHVAEYT